MNQEVFTQLPPTALLRIAGGLYKGDVLVGLLLAGTALAVGKLTAGSPAPRHSK